MTVMIFDTNLLLNLDFTCRMKTEFNDTFDGAMLCKEQQIAKIKEKNKRRRKILEDLGRDPSCVLDPALGVAEQPEQLLLVQDNEVKVEKYMSPEMQVDFIQRYLV